MKRLITIIVNSHSDTEDIGHEYNGTDLTDAYNNKIDDTEYSNSDHSDTDINNTDNYVPAIPL